MYSIVATHYHTHMRARGFHDYAYPAPLVCGPQVDKPGLHLIPTDRLRDRPADAVFRADMGHIRRRR